jgi:RES domain-containing protein
LSAIGSRVRGGRYNPKGRFEAFYLADTQETALYETEAIFASGGVVLGVRQPPRVMLSLDYELQCVVDLREPDALEHLRITLDDLRRPWKIAQAEGRPILTQRIGQAARSVGIEALLVPSARIHAGANLVVFPDRLRSRSTIELYAGANFSLPRYALRGGYVPR